MKKAFILLLIILSIALAGCGTKGSYCQDPYIMFEGTCCLDENKDGYCDTKELEDIKVTEEETPLEVPAGATKLDCSFYSIAPYLTCSNAEKVNGNLYLTFESAKNKQGDYVVKEVTFDDMPDCAWKGNVVIKYGGQGIIKTPCETIEDSDFIINFEYIDHEIGSTAGDFKTRGHIGSKINTLTAKIIELFTF